MKQAELTLLIAIANMKLDFSVHEKELKNLPISSVSAYQDKPRKLSLQTLSVVSVNIAAAYVEAMTTPDSFS